MTSKLNHIGFVVEDINQTLAVLEATFGAKELERRTFAEMGQTSSIVQMCDTRYELMEPVGEKGVVPSFLKKYGPGFHHISIHSDDLDETQRQLEAAGVAITFRMEDTMFTNPKTSGGVVYEITTRTF